MQFQQYGWWSETVVLRVSVSTNQIVSRQKYIFMTLDLGSLCVLRTVDRESKRISEIKISSMREYENHVYVLGDKSFHGIFQVPHSRDQYIYFHMYGYMCHLMMFQTLISKCTKLKKLDLRGLPVTFSHRIEAIQMLVTKNPGITWLGAPWTWTVCAPLKRSMWLIFCFICIYMMCVFVWHILF